MPEPDLDALQAECDAQLRAVLMDLADARAAMDRAWELLGRAERQVERLRETP